MKHRRRLMVLGALIVLGLATFVGVRWQLARLSSAIRTMPVEDAQDVALSAMADVVLDQSVLGQTRDDDRPILDQYANNPSVVRERATLVMTWRNACLLVKDLQEHGLQQNRIVNSEYLTQVPLDHRSDGWHNPYCVFSHNGKVAVFSGGDRGALKCDGLEGSAERLTVATSTPKLERLPNGVLFTIQAIRPDKDR